MRDKPRTKYQWQELACEAARAIQRVASDEAPFPAQTRSSRDAGIRRADECGGDRVIRLLPLLGGSIIGLASTGLSYWLADMPTELLVLILVVLAACCLVVGGGVAALRRMERINDEMRAHLSKHHPEGSDRA